jgi:hypothetical protein
MNSPKMLISQAKVWKFELWDYSIPDISKIEFRLPIDKICYISYADMVVSYLNKNVSQR